MTGRPKNGNYVCKRASHRGGCSNPCPACRRDTRDNSRAPGNQAGAFRVGRDQMGSRKTGDWRDLITFATGPAVENSTACNRAAPAAAKHDGYVRGSAYPRRMLRTDCRSAGGSSNFRLAKVVSTSCSSALTQTKASYQSNARESTISECALE